MADLASDRDVVALLRRPLTPDEKLALPALLEFASDTLLANEPAILAQMDAGLVMQSLVRLAVAQMIVRVLVRTVGVLSDTAGPSVTTFDKAVKGQIEYTDDERDLIFPNRKRQSVIRPATITMARPTLPMW